MPSKSFWDHPLDKLEEALNLKRQIHALQEKLSSLFASDSEEETTKTPARKTIAHKEIAPKAPAVTAKRGKRKGMSPAGRAKIAAAQRERWAKARAGVVPTSKAPVAKKARKGKRTVSPEVRARLADAMRARWASARRKGLPGPNVRR